MSWSQTKDKGVRVWIVWGSPTMEGRNGYLKTYLTKRYSSREEEYILFSDTDLAELLREERRKAFEAARYVEGEPDRESPVFPTADDYLKEVLDE